MELRQQTPEGPASAVALFRSPSRGGGTAPAPARTVSDELRPKEPFIGSPRERSR
jgi:hypothetical protein